VNQKLLVRTLTLGGYTTVTADNGEQAVDIYKRYHKHKTEMTPEEIEKETGKFDCIIMDVQMPLMDGMRATELIRSHELGLGDGSHVWIVGLSANARQHYHLQAKAAGMDHYLNKPSRKEEIFALLDSFFLED